MTVKDIYITDYTIHNLKVKKLSKKDFSDFLLRGGFYAEQNFAKISNTKTIWFACVSYINYNCNSTFSTVYHNGGGVFYYYGDFNVQEILFYQLVHDAVRNGDTGWMHNVDLGTDMLSSFQLLSSWQSVLLADNSVPE